MDQRPENCRNKLRDSSKPYPKSGCSHCGNGGIMGCPFEKASCNRCGVAHHPKNCPSKEGKQIVDKEKIGKLRRLFEFNKIETMEYFRDIFCVVTELPHEVFNNLVCSNSARANPYHNHLHGLSVMEHCFRLFWMIRSDVYGQKGFLRGEHRISKHSTLVLQSGRDWNEILHMYQQCGPIWDEDLALVVMVLAGMFHDFNHKGSLAKTDRENIREALSAFGIFEAVGGFKEIPAVSALSREQQNIVAMAIQDAITYTEFPFSEDPPKSIFQEIIRDADLLAAFGKDKTTAYQNIFTDLYHEIHCKEDNVLKPSYELKTEFAKWELKFVDEMVLYTDEAAEILEPLREEVRRISHNVMDGLAQAMAYAKDHGMIYESEKILVQE